MQQMSMAISSNTEELLFDWQLDVSRLEKEAYEAKQRRKPDFWALVEAECSLDLVDAEMAAVQGSPPSEARKKTLLHLQAWRLRLERVIRNLRALGDE